MPDKNWQFELEEYIKQGEPDRAEKSGAWKTAIGLQAVDGLNTSSYLLDTTKDHIEGKITIDEAQKRIHSYYEQRSVRTDLKKGLQHAHIQRFAKAAWAREKVDFSPIVEQVNNQSRLINIIEGFPSELLKTVNAHRQLFPFHAPASPHKAVHTLCILIFSQFHFTAESLFYQAFPPDITFYVTAQ